MAGWVGEDSEAFTVGAQPAGAQLQCPGLACVEAAETTPLLTLFPIPATTACTSAAARTSRRERTPSQATAVNVGVGQQPCQPAAGVLGYRIAEFVVDSGRAPPRVGGPGRVCHGLAGLAEPQEGLGLVVTIRGVAEEPDGLFVAVGRVVVFAESVVGESEAVQRGRLAVTVVA